MTKGQFLRLLLTTLDSSGNVPVAAATNLTLHISAQVENSTTKDSTGEWAEYEVTGLSYEINSEALVIAEDNPGEANLGDFFDMLNGKELAFNIAETDGLMNRNVLNVICSGNVLVSSVNANAANRQNSTVSVNLQGQGELQVAVADFKPRPDPSLQGNEQPASEEPSAEPQPGAEGPEVG